MWLFLNDAFISAVAYRPGKEKDLEELCGLSGKNLLLVRARSSAHLQALIDNHGLEDFQFMYRPEHDYAWGGLTRKEDFADVIAGYIETELQYTNYKASIQDDSLHDAAARVWGVMHSLQKVNKINRASKGQLCLND
jgi:hypothetical protein